MCKGYSQEGCPSHDHPPLAIPNLVLCSLTTMSTDHILVPTFAQLNLPPVEEYQKRKVALISGEGP